jgi:excisionase family DNA binding protein
MNLISVSEAMKVANVSRQTILRAAHAGEFESTRVGSRLLRISRDSFMRWLWGADWQRVVGENA